MAEVKKRNFIVNYFVPFGIKQISDILMLAGAITAFVGLFITEYGNLIITIGLAVCAIAAAITLVRTVLALTGNPKNSPVFKRAKVNVFIISAILALVLFGMIWGIVMLVA